MKKGIYASQTLPYILTLPFILSVKTDNEGISDVDQFSVPAVSSGIYDSFINWDDGSFVENIKTYDDIRWTHTFIGGVGTYSLKIWQTITGLSFSDIGDEKKLLDISQWGIFKTGNQSYVFQGASNLVITATDILDISNESTLRGFISGCSSIVSIPNFSSWNFSNIDSFREFADGASNYNDPGISSISAPLNTSLRAAFRNTSLNQNINNLITSNVTDIVNTLSNVSNFDKDLSGADVSGVADATNFLVNGSLSDENYESTLISWSNQSLQNSVPCHFGNSEWRVGLGGLARYNIIATYAWDITDGGRNDPNLLGWFSGSNIYAETANPSDSSSLTQWSDLSGRDYDAASVGTAPVFTANAINGQAAATFDGNNSRFKSATNTFEQIRGSDFTIFIVSKASAPVTSPQRLFEATDVGQTVQEVFVKVPANGNVMQFRSGGSTISTECTPENANIFTCKFVEGSSMSIQVNGETAATGTPSQSNLFTDRITIGARAGGLQCWDGDIAEVIVYNKILDTTEEVRIKTYLSGKYGISLVPGAGGAGIKAPELIAQNGDLIEMQDGSFLRVGSS